MKRTLTIGLFLLAITYSCGPRSGIHDDAKNNATIGAPEDTSARYREQIRTDKLVEKGERLFKQNCAVCHASHTDQYLTGPGLKGVFDRLPKPAEDYFIKYTINSDSVFRSGDKYAKKINAECGNLEMTVFEGSLTTEDIREIIKYLTTPRRLPQGDVVY